MTARRGWLRALLHWTAPTGWQCRDQATTGPNRQLLTCTRLRRHPGDHRDRGAGRDWPNWEIR